MKQLCGVLLAVVVLTWSVESMAFRKGNIVAIERGGDWYIAMIVKDRGNNKFNLICGDAGHFDDIPASRLRDLPYNPQLKLNARVWALFNDADRFLKGSVMEIKALSYKIKWDDGRAPSWVPAGRLFAE